MPQIIEVPELGQVEFPDGMSDADIVSAIRDNLAKPIESPEQMANALRAQGGANYQPMGQMTTTNEGLAEIANDPSQIPAAILGAVSIPGQMAYAAAADVVSQVSRRMPSITKVVNEETGDVTQYAPGNQAEYGGNILYGDRKPWQDAPADQFLASVAQTNPNLATVGRIGQSLSAMSPLAVVGMLPANLGKLAAAGFTVDMIRHAPEQFTAYAEEINKPIEEQNPDTLARLRSDIIQTFTFAPLAGAHAVKGLQGEIGYALDLARESAPRAPRAQVETTGRSVLPMEEGAPVPTWEATDAIIKPRQVPISDRASQSDVARTAEAEAAPSVTTKPPQTITGSNVQTGTEMPVSPAKAGGATTATRNSRRKTQDSSPAKPVDMPDAVTIGTLPTQAEVTAARAAEAVKPVPAETQKSTGGKIEIKVKNPYGLAPEAEKIQHVIGTAITLKGAPGHEFVVYKPISGKYWRVVERSSGLSFGNQAEKTQAAAIAAAEKALATVKPGLFDQVVRDAQKLNPTSKPAATPDTRPKTQDSAPAQPAEAPAQAVAKVQEHVAEVASGEKAVQVQGPKSQVQSGPRPAKEIKSELVQRLEEAIAKAPAEADVIANEVIKVRVGVDAKGKPTYGGKTMRELAELNTPESLKIYQEMRFRALQGSGKKTTVEIPGDGTFTIWNTKEALAEVMQKAKRLDTSSGKGPAISYTGISKADREWIAQNKQTIEAPAQVAPGINTGNLGEMGMGGAKPGEFRNNPQTPTGIRNAIVDQERVRRGLPPAMEAARREFGTVWDEAMARIDQEPEATSRLVQELQAKPRALSDTENALLLHRQIELQNEYGRLTRDLAQAYDDSQSFPNRLADVEELKARVASTSDRLQEVYDVGKAVGTEQGRGLNARKMLAFEDYSLAKMELEKRAAKGGGPLTDAERAEVVKLQERIARTEAEFQAYREKQEAARAERMTDEAIREMQDELKRRPQYDLRIIKIAEEIVGKLEKQAVSAQERLKAKFARTNTGLDPTIVYDLGVVGAAKIARFGLDFGKFSAEMLAEYGAGVKDYLAASWERANLHLENEGAKYGDKAPAIKNILRKRDATSKRENVIAGLKKGKAEGIPVQMEGDYIRKLAEGFVEAGIRTREALVDAVHEVLTKEVGLELTRRETMDAISGYGKYKALNPNAIKATLRDLRGQMQQVAKLEDIEARKPLQKTGLERRTPSDEERRLLQQVNEAKRRFGVVVNDPARQLKSALDAIKTRLKHQISDIEYQINTRERIVKTKTPAPFDAETKLLETRRDALRAQLDELVPKPGLTVAQQIQRVANSLERSIADYEARIKGGDVAARERKTPLSTPELEALRSRRDAARAEWEELRDLADPGRKERQALSAVKARLAQSTANYMDRLARHDFKKRERYEPRLDAEALRLKAENEIAKREFQRGLIMDRLANRTLGQKVYAGVKESLNLPRNLLSSWDVSAVLRQGGFIALGNPLRAAAGLGPMFKALASEKAAIAVEQEILSRPNAPLYKQSKLYLAPHEALHLSAMEEAIMSRLAGKVPGLRASNRAYITFLNRLRADSFDALVNSIARKDGNLTPPELQAVANYINVATGRGDLGKASAAAETLATVFFSPRLLASRFQLLAGQPLYRGSARTRMAIAQEYGKFLAGIGVVYALGALSGATIEPDPRSSDFGKLKFGNTRVDVLGGLSQTTTLLGRLTSGQTITASGQVRDIRGDVPYGARTSADVIANFLRSKLSPVVGTSVDIAQGRNVVGEPVTPKTVAVNMTVPLSFRDIYDVMAEQGMARGTILGVLSLFGFGLQQYETKAASPEVTEIMKRVRGVTPEQRDEIRKRVEESLK